MNTVVHELQAHQYHSTLCANFLRTAMVNRERERKYLESISGPRLRQRRLRSELRTRTRYFDRKLVRRDKDRRRNQMLAIANMYTDRINAALASYITTRLSAE